MSSLRQTLLLSMLLAITGFVGVSAAVIHYELADEIGELYDSALAREAEAALRAPVGRDADFATRDDDPGTDIVVLRWGPGAEAPRSMIGANEAPAARLTIDRPAAAGFRTLRLDGRRWRLYSAIDGDVRATAAQPLAVREQATRKIEVRFIAPVALLAVVAAGLVWLLIGRGLSPLRRFAGEVSRRSPGALRPVATRDLPAELVPVAAALNDLLARLERALAAQQTFVADAAHELLTPLTALDVHVQALERAKTDERRAAARGDLQAGLQRCIRLARQLLALARQSPDAGQPPLVAVDLAEVAATAVADAHAAAVSRGVDLGVTSDVRAVVRGDPDALRLMLRNVTDNAIKYGPAQGRVDVSVGTTAAGAWLRVSDTGPGIPEADRQRVFDRFFRRPGHDAEGSGLGLAIVREIAARHGAEVDLASPGLLGGLDVTIRFPAHAASTDRQRAAG